MAKKDEIKALRAEVTGLRIEVANLAAQIACLAAAQTAGQPTVPWWQYQQGSGIAPCTTPFPIVTC